MKISILLPTRKRVKPLVDTIKSLLDNISPDNKIEILLRFDDDDLDTVMAVKESVKRDIGDVNDKIVKYYIGQRYGYAELYRCVNEIASRAEGDWFIGINDDCLMMTKNWDKNIEKYNGQIVFSGYLFNVIPRKAFEIWGHISPCSHGDTWLSDVAGRIESMGYHVNVDMGIGIFHDRADITGHNDDETFRERDYQTDYYSLENELIRIHDVELLKEYLDREKLREERNVNMKIDIDNVINNFKKMKNDMLLYHHDDQINLQKNEYELLTKLKPEVLSYPLFKLICHIIPFWNSVPHIFTLLKLARYSKICILEIGSCHGESAVALGIGAKIYGANNPKLVTIDDVQSEKEAKGYFELFKEFLPSARHAIKIDPKNFSFNEPIDLLYIDGSYKREDVYAYCKKYIPLVVKGGIIVFHDTGSKDITSSIITFLLEKENSIKYELLPVDPVNNNSKFTYNNVCISAIRII